MVDFAQLRDAKPELWQTAADDWLTLAKEAEQSARDIYDNGASALDEHWTDQIGQHAGQALKDMADLIHGTTTSPTTTMSAPTAIAVIVSRFPCQSQNSPVGDN